MLNIITNTKIALSVIKAANAPLSFLNSRATTEKPDGVLVVTFSSFAFVIVQLPPNLI